MSKIKNGGLDQYGTEPFKWQLFVPAGVEGVNAVMRCALLLLSERGVMYEFRLTAKNGVDYGVQASASLLTTDGSESMTSSVTSRDRK